MTGEQRDPPAQLTGTQRALALAAAVLFTALAGLAFTGMFASVQAEMRRYFGGLAWIVPVGVDAGVLALILAGLLLEWLTMPMPSLRWIAGVFMAASIWLNVAAADGRATGAVGHAALPVLFIACVEAIRHAVRRRAGIAAGTVREGIPLARWLLSPGPTFALWRRMVLWQVTSYVAAIRMEQDRRRAIAQLRAAYGEPWQRAAPADVAWMLRTGIHLDQAVRQVTTITRRALPSSDAAGGLTAGRTPDPAHQPRGRRPHRPAGPPAQPVARAAQPGSAGVHERSRTDDPDLEAEALALLATEPGISGGELGRRLGVTERHGRRLRMRLGSTGPGSEPGNPPDLGPAGHPDTGLGGRTGHHPDQDSGHEPDPVPERQPDLAAERDRAAWQGAGRDAAMPGQG